MTIVRMFDGTPESNVYLTFVVMLVLGCGFAIYVLAREWLKTMTELRWERKHRRKWHAEAMALGTDQLCREIAAWVCRAERRLGIVSDATLTVEERAEHIKSRVSPEMFGVLFAHDGGDGLDPAGTDGKRLRDLWTLAQDQRTTEAERTAALRARERIKRKYELRDARKGALRCR